MGGIVGLSGGPDYAPDPWSYRVDALACQVTMTRMSYLKDRATRKLNDIKVGPGLAWA